MTEFRKASAAVETVEKLIGELQGDVKLAEQGELPAESHARWTEVSWTYLGNPWENHGKFWSQWFYQLQVISCYIIIIYNNYITYHHSLSSFLHCFIFLWRYLGLSTILKQRQVEKQFNELSPVAEKMQRRCDARSELEKLKEELRALLPPCSPEECMKKAQELVDGQVSGFESVQEILSKALDLEATATRWWFQRFFEDFPSESQLFHAIPSYLAILGSTFTTSNHTPQPSPAIPQPPQPLHSGNVWCENGREGPWVVAAPGEGPELLRGPAASAGALGAAAGPPGRGVGGGAPPATAGGRGSEGTGSAGSRQKLEEKWRKLDKFQWTFQWTSWDSYGFVMFFWSWCFFHVFLQLFLDGDFAW